MRLDRAFFVIAGVLGGAIVATSMTSGPTPREPVRTAAGASATADPIAALQREVDVLKERIQRPRLVPLPAGQTRNEEATTVAPASASTPLSASEQAAEIAETLDAHYTSEPADRAWSDKLRAELGAALGMHTGTTLSSAQCTVSLCKVTLLHETVDAQRDLVSIVASLPALSAGAFYHYEDGAEPPRTMLYVVREGHNIRELLAAR